MASASAQLIALLDDYKDPVGYLHPKLRPEYVKKSAAQLREMKKLLKAGADWRARPDEDAPFTAAFFNDPRPLEVLLDHGVPLDHTRRKGETLLHWAAAFGRKHVVKLLADRGASLLAIDGQGKTPLERARSWKHGADALPLLTRLTTAALKAEAKKPATMSAKKVPTGDLTKAAVLAAIKTKPKAFSKSALRGIETFAKAVFAASPATTFERFLDELSEQDTDEVVAAGLWVVAQASSAKPTMRREKAGTHRIAHHGDVVIDGDCEALAIAVTGSLTVKGRLTNWEGRSVHVGGSLVATALASEGPLWIQGDATVKKAVLASYNDHRLTVIGTLTTPVFVQDDHALSIGRRKIGAFHRSWKAIPAAKVKRIRRALGFTA